MNKPNRIGIVVGLLSILTLPFASSDLAAQSWPVRPIKVVVPFPPGGAVDAVTRLVTTKMESAIGQPMVVENKAGAGGLIGAEQVANSAPDGYTILMGTVSTHAIAPAVHRKMPYDPVTDFSPISLVALTPYVIAVHLELPVKTLRELIEVARANPGAVNFGSTGTGTTPHLAGELFATMAGVRLNHVPYKGSTPMLVDLLSNQVQLAFDNSVIPNVRAGKLRALAVTGTARLAPIPEIPTAQEAGLPGYEAVGWIGFFGPKGLDSGIASLLARETGRALQAPDVKESLATRGLQGSSNTPESFAAYLRAESTKWEKVVREAKIPQQ